MKKKHIKNLKEALSTSGLGLFLIAGLSGCDGDNVCDKENKYLSQREQLAKKECRENSYISVPVTNTSSHSSGFFAPSSTYHSSYSSGG